MPTSPRPTANAFPKAQRLCSRKLAEQLFASGNRTLSAFPLRVVFMAAPWPGSTDTKPSAMTEGACQVMMSVSKRMFKHAVDRNRAKRQMREAWRLNRHILLPAISALEGRMLLCAFIWTARTPQPSDTVHRKMRNLLHRIAEQRFENPTDRPLTEP